MKRIWKERVHSGGSLLEKLLAARQVPEQEVSRFLDPQYAQAHDPFLLTDMRKAVARIMDAMSREEQITVYADYDADAVTAAAVLLRFFRQLNYMRVDYYIPDRFTEGYGMNPSAVKMLQERGTKVIITVDCGINAFEPSTLARKLDIDLIITDHHQLTGGGIPDAVAVVNPHRPDDNYPFKHLTGVGVAFKLVQALTKQLTAYRLPLTAGREKWLLDLVAIGTVADCQALLDENRMLVKWGLVVLAKTRWPGLRKLMDLAKIKRQDVDTYKIGFIIAPRINAAGRMEHADTALNLLMTDDETEAELLAQKLEDLNQHRQDQTERILSEAREQLVVMNDHKILLAAGEGWHKGIVGLVAGRLTEEFSRPVLVLDKSAEEATGSARSVGSFNIIEAIGHSHSILTRYGGHPQAAGFTLRTEHIETFRKNLLAYADTALSADDLTPVLHYDGEIDLGQVSAEFVEFIARFEPTGIGNPRPRFRINNLVMRSFSTVGREGKHLRMDVGLGSIAFNLGFWADKLQIGDRVDVICEPQFNVWNGERKVQLKIIDLSVT